MFLLGVQLHRMRVDLGKLIVGQLTCKPTQASPTTVMLYVSMASPVAVDGNKPLLC
jgi:hypothetical protein